MGGGGGMVGNGGAFHFPRYSGSDVNNGTHVCQAFHCKRPGSKKNFEKVARSIREFSHGIHRPFALRGHGVRFYANESYMILPLKND